MGEGWELGSPQPFQDEATLHSLIEQNPQLLPLVGSPRLPNVLSILRQPTEKTLAIYEIIGIKERCV